MKDYKQPNIPDNKKKELQTGYRDIGIAKPENFFERNSVSTTKYTLLTFFPLNLVTQFNKIANLYFLFLAILQMTPRVTISNRLPTIIPPLTFIVLLSMIKDAFEDYKRYKSDQEENNKPCWVYRNGTFARTTWNEVRVGDLVKVLKDTFFPCDLILLASSEYKKGQCFIETKNLDGETNLKGRFVPDDVKQFIKCDEDALKFLGSYANVEGPNQYLSKFKGTIEHAGAKIPMNQNNFLLRGCILRNVEYVLGIATYTG